MIEFDEATIVRVENYGDTDYSDSYDNRKYNIPAGATMYLPLGACCVWLGNINAYGDERQSAVEHIRHRHGYTTMSSDSWEAYAPKLVVYDQASGDRIWFPADDPENVHGSADASFTGAIAVDTVAEVQNLKQQLAELREALGHPAPTPVDTAGDPVGIPVDSATKTGFRGKGR